MAKERSTHEWNDSMSENSTESLPNYEVALDKIATVLATADDADGAIEKIGRILKALGK